MKILIVSLLRLGDVLQQEILIEGLRKKHPGAQIDLLVNAQFSQLKDLLGSKIDQIHYFDRTALQKGLGEAGYNIMWSYDKLNSLIQTLNDQAYDQVINFTHNKLSAYLIGTLNIQEKQGLHQSEGRFCGLDNAWLKYFNERFSGSSHCLFNYVELLAGSFSIPLPPPQSKVVGKSKNKTIYFQCLTSDEKKNWGLEKFLRLKEEIEQSLNDYRVKILAAPFEKDTLLTVFKEEDLVVCNMTEARDILQNAPLLVTGDTSVKHLAARLGTPLVELALGGSSLQKTGAYSENVIGLKSNVACAPCTHSGPCNQSGHLCADEISVDQVFTAVWDQLSQENRQLNLDQNYLDRLVWRESLDSKKTPLTDLAALAETIKQRPSPILNLWQKKTDELLLIVDQFRNVLPSAQSLQGRSALNAMEVSRLVAVAQNVVREKIDGGGYLQRALETLMSKHRDGLHFIEQMNTALQEAQDLLKMRTETVQALLALTHGGHVYAKGFGKLSGVGFDEVGRKVSGNLENADL